MGVCRRWYLGVGASGEHLDGPDADDNDVDSRAIGADTARPLVRLYSPQPDAAEGEAEAADGFCMQRAYTPRCRGHLQSAITRPQMHARPTLGEGLAGGHISFGFTQISMPKFRHLDPYFDPNFL